MSCDGLVREATGQAYETAWLVKTVVSNSNFDRGSLSPSYIRPFDVFANGDKTGDWLLGLDSHMLARGARVPARLDLEIAREDKDARETSVLPERSARLTFEPLERISRRLIRGGALTLSWQLCTAP